jgi:hypothetical protein
MSSEPLIVIRLGRRTLVVAAVILVLAVAFVAAPSALQAQKVQEKYSEKFNIADPNRSHPSRRARTRTVTVYRRGDPTA